MNANTAIFSVVNGVLISALPLPDPDRLVRVGMVEGVSSLLRATRIQQRHALRVDE